MHYLFVGEVTPINVCIVKDFLNQEAVHVSWFLPNEQNPPSDLKEKSNTLNFHFLEKPFVYSDKLFELPKTLKFKGVVFGETKGGVRPVKMLKDNFIREMFEANVFSFFDLIRSLLKTKHLAQGSSVVALSSVSSVKGLKSKSVYSASKAALDAAVRGVAAELAPQGIRVNSILKGWVDADMSLDFIQSNMKLSNGSDYEQQLLGAIKPDEIANLVTFLLSDKVRSITGTNIIIDGGYTL